MKAMVPVVEEAELLVIERLAAALEKAASVDEIKDVRDRAMAIQLYCRKKVGGLAACQSAGRVVTDATIVLARLYAEEPTAKGANLDSVRVDSKRGLVRDQDHDLPSDCAPDSTDRPVGKAAIARAADMEAAALSRLKPLTTATPAVIRAATQAIESAGEVATPAALLRHVTAVSAESDYDGDEWYTPPDIIRRVRAVLGGIDLDPASNPMAQKAVQAARYLTKEDNSLTLEWGGRVFCNPPYSMPLIEQFTTKLLAEFDGGRVVSALCLVNNCTDTAWFHAMLSRFPVCFTRGRLGFYARSGRKQAARQGQAFFYLGADVASFREHFLDVGEVVAHGRP